MTSRRNWIEVSSTILPRISAKVSPTYGSRTEILIALINFVLVISVSNVVPVDSKYGSNPGTSAQVVCTSR